jgi:TetR/AcrR family transcriptional repressor of nem operon
MPTKGTITKERILSKAIGLIQRRGIASTSINDLQKATGMTKGSLYFHFKNKDAVAHAALEKARTDHLAFLDSALAGKTPGEALNNFFREVVAKHKAVGFVGG